MTTMTFPFRRFLATTLAASALPILCIAAGTETEPVRLLVVTGGHPYDEPQFWEMFDSMEGIEHESFVLRDHSELFDNVDGWRHDVVLFYNMTQEITDERVANFMQLTEWGVGLVPLHHGTLSWPFRPEFKDIFGVQFPEAGGPFGFHIGEQFTYRITDPDHPITQGMQEWTAIDETYTNYYGQGIPGNRVLLTTDHKPADPQLAWVRRHNNSRIANLQGGHDRLMFENPAYRDLIRRSVLWTAGRLPEEIGGEALPHATIFRDQFEIPAAIAGVRDFREGESRLWLTRAEELLRGEYAGDAETSALITGGLASVALDATASREARSWSLRQLGVFATAEDLAAIAPLVSDNDLGHMALYALEQNPRPEAAALLRDALATTTGDARRGATRSLAAKRDAASVPALVALLSSSNLDDASAAASALAAIGGADARDALLAARGAVPNADEALLAWSELADDEDALAVYQALHDSTSDDGVKAAALRGVLARSSDASALWAASIASDDANARAAAIYTLPRLQATSLKDTVASALPALVPAEQVALLHALELAPAHAPLDAIAALLASPDADVAITAGYVLGALGDASSAAAVLAAIEGADGALRDVLRDSLASMPDPAIDAMLLDSLQSREGDGRVALIEALTARLATDAAPALVALIGDDNRPVRIAALDALGELGSLDEARALIASMPAAAAPERRACARALSRIAERMDDNAPMLAALRDGIASSGADAAAALLPVVAGLATPDARDFLTSILQDAASPLREDAARALAAWPDRSPAEALLEVAASAEGTLQLLAARGYLSLLANEQSLTPGAMLAEARRVEPHLAGNAELKRQFLNVVARCETGESLAIARAYIQDADVQADALAAVRSLAASLINDYPAEVAAALQGVIDSDMPQEVRDEAAVALREARELSERVVANWSFTSGADGWEAQNQVTLEARDGTLVATSTGADPFLAVTVDIPEQPLVLKFRARYDDPGVFQFFMETDRATMVEPGSVLTITPNPGTEAWQEHEVAFTPPGNLRVFRLDPAGRDGQVVVIDHIRLLKPEGAPPTATP